MAVLAPSRPRRREPQHRGRRWIFPRVPFLVSVVFLIGVLVLLYPTIASWFAQYNQSQQIVGYGKVIESVGPEGRDEALAEARRYNEALIGGAVVDAFTRLPVGAEVPESEFDYYSLLSANDRTLMARLRIPKIEVDLPVFHGTGEDVLREGIGHIEGTSLPVGGPSTHAVLTGHRGLAEAVILSNLDQIVEGDTFTVETFGDVMTYEVLSTAVVEPHETQTLYPQPGRDLVTLVTCTPIGVNSHRILVTGERIVPTPIEEVVLAEKDPDLPHFPWWTLAIGGSLLLVTGYVIWSGRTAAAAGNLRANVS